MKKKIIISIIIITAISLPIIFKMYHREDKTIYDKNSDTYKINGIVYTKEKLIDKCFKLSTLDKNYINEFKIEPDIEEAYAIDVKLIIPENQIIKIFNFIMTKKK